ncbi:MAG: hypothetical protein HKP42_05930, partial [Maribacter sp.]|nr:hypothetical protein [Maribacter sp.]
FYTVRNGWGANRGKEFVDHFYKRTYAQRFNQQVYYLYESSLSFLHNSLSLKQIIEKRFILPNRDSINNPPVWPPMVAMDKYRNIRMTSFFEKDSAMIKAQTDIWHNPNFKNNFVDSVDVIINHYVSLAHKLEARGGKVVFIRPPVSEWYLTEEAEHFPREKYWDRLIDECNCLGYSYEDFKETKDMIPPEWSHLNRKDSDEYTKFLVNQLSKDKIL